MFRTIKLNPSFSRLYNILNSIKYMPISYLVCTKTISKVGPILFDGTYIGFFWVAPSHLPYWLALRQGLSCHQFIFWLSPKILVDSSLFSVQASFNLVQPDINPYNVYHALSSMLIHHAYCNFYKKFWTFFFPSIDHRYLCLSFEMLESMFGLYVMMP